MTTQEAIQNAERILGRKVVRVMNPYALPHPDLTFLRNATRRSIASYFDNDDGSVHIYVKDPLIKNLSEIVFQESLYRVTAELGPEGLLRTPEQWYLFEKWDSVSGAAAKEAARVVNDYSKEGQRHIQHILTLIGVKDEYQNILALCNGMKSFNDKAMKRDAINEGNVEVLAELMKQTLAGESKSKSVSFGKAEGPWLDVGYPELNITASVDSVRKCIEKSGFSSEQEYAAFIEAVRKPIAVLKYGRKDIFSLVLDIKDSNNEFICVNVSKPDILKTNIERNNIRYPSVCVSGFPSLSESSLLRALSYQKRENGKIIDTNLVYVTKKEGLMYSSRLLDVVRSFTKDIIKKASLGPRRCANLDVTTETLSIGSANIDNVFETTKKFLDTPQDSEEEKEYKKATPSERRVGAQDATTGGLNIGSAKIDNVFESVKKSFDIPFDVQKENAINNITECRNIGQSRSVAQKIAEEINAQEVLEGVRENVVVTTADPRAAALTAFSEDALEAFRADGIVDAGTLKDTVLKMQEAAFVERYGARAWNDALDFLEGRALITLNALRKPPVDLAAARQDFEGERVRDFKEVMLRTPGNLVAGSVAMPRFPTGELAIGSDAHYMAARIVTTPRWEGCSLFVFQEDLDSYGLSLTSNADPVLSGTFGSAAYNLMDTDMSPMLRDEIMRLASDTPAFPVTAVTQMRSILPSAGVMDASQMQGLQNYLDRSWRNVTNGYELGARKNSLETLIMKASARLEKKLDPSGLMRGFGFPEESIRMLVTKGEAVVMGKIHTNKESSSKGPGSPRRACFKIKVVDGKVKAYTMGGVEIADTLKAALSKPDLSKDSLAAFEARTLRFQQQIGGKGLK